MSFFEVVHEFCQPLVVLLVKTDTASREYKVFFSRTTCKWTRIGRCYRVPCACEFVLWEFRSFRGSEENIVLAEDTKSQESMPLALTLGRRQLSHWYKYFIKTLVLKRSITIPWTTLLRLLGRSDRTAYDAPRLFIILLERRLIHIACVCHNCEAAYRHLN